MEKTILVVTSNKETSLSLSKTLGRGGGKVVPLCPSKGIQQLLDTMEDHPSIDSLFITTNIFDRFGINLRETLNTLRGVYEDLKIFVLSTGGMQEFKTETIIGYGATAFFHECELDTKSSHKWLMDCAYDKYRSENHKKPDLPKVNIRTFVMEPEHGVVHIARPINKSAVLDINKPKIVLPVKTTAKTNMVEKIAQKPQILSKPIQPREEIKTPTKSQEVSFDEKLVTAAFAVIRQTTAGLTDDSITSEDLNLILSSALEDTLSHLKKTLRRQLLSLQKTRKKIKLSPKITTPKPVNDKHDEKVVESPSKKYKIIISHHDCRRSCINFMGYNFFLSHEQTHLFCFIVCEEGRVIPFQEIMDKYSLQYASVYQKVHGLRQRLGESNFRLVEIISYKKDTCRFNPLK